MSDLCLRLVLVKLWSDFCLQRGFTPLHVAAKYGNLKVVQMLIRRGTNPNVEGKNGLTPLHVATHYNRVNVALYLLEKNASSQCATKV